MRKYIETILVVVFSGLFLYPLMYWTSHPYMTQMEIFLKFLWIPIVLLVFFVIFVQIEKKR